jgi:protein-disulfide isomerase
MPLEFHQHAFLAAKAARCAGEQGKYWEMRQAILESTEEPTKELVSKRASALLSDSQSFQSCLDSQKHQASINKDLQDAESLQIYGTPTFIIALSAPDKLNGIRMMGALTFPEFQSAVDQLLDIAPATTSKGLPGEATRRVPQP